MPLNSLDELRYAHNSFDFEADGFIDSYLASVDDGVGSPSCRLVLAGRPEHHICVSGLKTSEPHADGPGAHLSYAQNAFVRIEQFWAASSIPAIGADVPDSRVNLESAFRTRTAILVTDASSAASRRIPPWTESPVGSDSFVILPLGASLYFGETSFAYWGTADTMGIAGHTVRFHVQGFFIDKVTQAATVALGAAFYPIVPSGSF